MSVNRPIKRSFALVAVVLVSAVVIGILLGGRSVAAGASGRPVGAIVDSRGNPNAVPPILPAATPSELAALRSAEARERAAFDYRVPANARYSLAELNAYASAVR